MPRMVRIVLGLLLAAFGIWLIFSPMVVANVLQRPHETVSQRINLRASWGGAVLGAGMLVTWLDALQPRRRFVLTSLLCAMTGVAIARAVGFVLDGTPNALQWAWIIAEVVISAVCGMLLYRDGKKQVAVT